MVFQKICLELHKKRREFNQFNFRDKIYHLLFFMLEFILNYANKNDHNFHNVIANTDFLRKRKREEKK